GVYVVTFPAPRQVCGDAGTLKYVLLRMSFVAVCRALPTSVVDRLAPSVNLADLSPVELYDSRPPTIRLTVVTKISARIREAPSSFVMLLRRDVMTPSS